MKFTSSFNTFSVLREEFDRWKSTDAKTSAYFLFVIRVFFGYDTVVLVSKRLRAAHLTLTKDCLHSFTLSTTTAVTFEHCEGPSDYLGNTTLKTRVGLALCVQISSNPPSELNLR